ncbi:hypothetical protein O3P69_007150 [Scylla paramamosain]|uniref:Uncharacterized protein n=1 Tax=Scylla paramamosain TaxID=85552 RepID=A0AAW0V1K7_SCYPA
MYFTYVIYQGRVVVKYVIHTSWGQPQYASPSHVHQRHWIPFVLCTSKPASVTQYPVQLIDPDSDTNHLTDEAALRTGQDRTTQRPQGESEWSSVSVPFRKPARKSWKQRALQEEMSAVVGRSCARQGGVTAMQRLGSAREGRPGPQGRRESSKADLSLRTSDAA